jgi:hypothetical protein
MVFVPLKLLFGGKLFGVDPPFFLRGSRFRRRAEKKERKKEGKVDPGASAPVVALVPPEAKSLTD